MKKLLAMVLVLAIIYCTVSTCAVKVKAETVDGYQYFYTLSRQYEVEITSINPKPGGDFIIPETLAGYPVTVLSNFLFSDSTHLTSVIIPNSVKEIGYKAFFNCTRLTDINLPDTIESIGAEVFYNTAYYNNDTNWENDVLYIGKHLIKGRESVVGDYTIKNDTLTIADKAFNNCKNLSSIMIPNSVTRIGYSAFNMCGVEKVSIGKGLVSMGDWAFAGCRNLNSITIDDGAKSIGYHAFDNCVNLTDITIPGSITSMGLWAFCGCEKLTNIVIADGVTHISKCAFGECTALKNIIIPSSVISVGEGAFGDCDGSITNVWYIGSDEERKNISIEDNNYEFVYANWHYNICDIKEHSYENDKDETCENCEWIRVVINAGDTNGDNSINNKDLGLLMQYINNWNVEINVDAADVNGDGKVNNKDLGLLMQYINNWDVELQ